MTELFTTEISHLIHELLADATLYVKIKSSKMYFTLNIQHMESYGTAKDVFFLHTKATF